MPLKTFADLTEREILALAITLEEEDSRIYATSPTACAADYPGLGEDVRRHGRGGERAPRQADRSVPREVRRAHPADPPRGREAASSSAAPLWLTAPLGLDAVRKQAEIMEFEAARFYEQGAERRRGRRHAQAAGRPRRGRERPRDAGAASSDRAAHRRAPQRPRRRRARRMFVLQYVQPGLAGLMDGSVSTLAPLFAAAFATHSNWQTFLVGLAASIGAGISHGLRRGAVRRRRAHRPRPALAARHRLRPDDDARRPRPHAALSHARTCRTPATATRRRGRRAVELWAIAWIRSALHGHAVPAGRLPGRPRRRAGASRPAF